MARSVWKYAIPLGEEVTISRPQVWRPVHVGKDPAGALCVWAEVETGGAECRGKLQWVGTGHPIPTAGAYIGIAHDGPFVWHLYGLLP